MSENSGSGKHWLVYIPLFALILTGSAFGTYRIIDNSRGGSEGEVVEGGQDGGDGGSGGEEDDSEIILGTDGRECAGIGVNGECIDESGEVARKDGEIIYVERAAGEQDNRAPVVYATYSTTEPTNGDVVVVIRANEAIGVPVGWEYASGVLVNEIKKVYKENRSEVVEVADLAGNITEVRIVVNNIDRAAPVVSNLRYSTTAPTKQDVVVSFETNKDVQTPDGWEQDGSARKFKRTFAANWSGRVTVRDMAGNTASVNVAVGNIDKAPLTARMLDETASFNPSNGNLSSVTIRIEVSKPADSLTSGLSGWTRLSETTWSKVFTANVNETIVLTDKVGNTASYTLRVMGIGEHAGIYNANKPTLTQQ
ncbi:hypothetical protein FWG86_00015 [Candidatus Saccharibacteria bacterium]|nr:hypothetical protein [Candidatus Saccharibacteria bacterium]